METDKGLENRRHQKRNKSGAGRWQEDREWKEECESLAESKMRAVTQTHTSLYCKQWTVKTNRQTVDLGLWSLKNKKMNIKLSFKVFFNNIAANDVFIYLVIYMSKLPKGYLHPWAMSTYQSGLSSEQFFLTLVCLVSVFFKIDHPAWMLSI